MGTRASRPPNDDPGSPTSPGWRIETERIGDGWRKWRATETTTNREASGPAAGLAVLLLLTILLLSDPDENDDDPVDVYQSDDWWVARHTELGVSSQGRTRNHALDNLEEAVALRRGEAGERIETEDQEREVLEDLGINPDELVDEPKDPPEFMQ